MKLKPNDLLLSNNVNASFAADTLQRCDVEAYLFDNAFVTFP